MSNITVNPPDRGGPPDLKDGNVVVTIGSGITEVDFTDTPAVMFGSCNPSSSLSVLLVNGNNVAAYVPLSNWNQPKMTGVAVANIEGNYINNSPQTVPIPDYINSCISDPSLSLVETVCTASSVFNQTDAVYVIQGNNYPFTVTQLHSGASQTIHFSGGDCTNCGIALGGNDQAVIALSHAGVPAFRFLDLSSNTFPWPINDSHAGQISEDVLIDPMANLLLSPAEGEKCVGVPSCHPNYEIVDITTPASPVFYENRLDNLPGWPTGFPESAGEDCSTGIILSSIETPGPPVSTPYIADLSKACFSPSCGAAPGTWTDSAYAFYPLSGSLLGTGNPAPGPIAIAQGGSHEGVLGQETGSAAANTITAFRLNPTFSASPYADWVTCNLGNDPSGSLFNQGFDPHTLTAYQSPNKDTDGTYHSFAVIANQAPASYVAVVDLDLMLGTVQRLSGTNVCSGGIPVGTPGSLQTTPGVVRFVKLR